MAAEAPRGQRRLDFPLMQKDSFIYLEIIVLLLQISKPTGSKENPDFVKIQSDFWSWKLENFPEFAASIGIERDQNKLTQRSLQQYEKIKKDIENFSKRLGQITIDEVMEANRLSYLILQESFDTYLDGYRWLLYGALNPINFMEGIQVSPRSTVESYSFDKEKDFEDYTEQDIQLMEKAIQLNRTLHKVSMSRVPEQLDKMLVSHSNDSVFFTIFKKKLDNSSLDDKRKKQLLQEALDEVNTTLSAYDGLRTFIKTKYMGETRPGLGVGTEYYRACLKWHLSVDKTPQEVHDLGIREIKRIMANVKKLMKKEKFTGSVRSYFTTLTNDSRFLLNSSDEILAGYRNIVFDRIAPKLPEEFRNYPKTSLTIEPSESDGVLAYYEPGTADGEKPGRFVVNVKRPRESPTFVMMALSLHEALPGHHFQISYTAKADLPNWRKYSDFQDMFTIPFHYPSYTAYTEGWGLYSEYLGEKLGVYKDDYEMLGRYSFELLRACRLVVDTGLHVMNWTRDRAVAFMMKNTAESRANIEIEVDRYVSFPGQACAYKVGEITIKNLREKARNQLGRKFDVAEFHANILENGGMSLSLLEMSVEKWIMSKRSTGTRPLAGTMLLGILITLSQFFV